MAATFSKAAQTQYATSVTGGTTPADLQIRDVRDWTKKMQRVDTPLLNLIGRAPAPDVVAHKAEWGWGFPDPFKNQLAEALDDSETAVTVDDGTQFAVSDVIAVDDETMLVTAIATNDLTVVRGFGDSAAAIHADDAVVMILAPAVEENDDDPASVVTQGMVDFNYHQIMSWTWRFSQRAAVTPTYESRSGGAGDRFKMELRKKMEQTAPLKLEQNLIQSWRNIGDAGGDGNNPSTFGGFKQTSYITTRIDLAGVPLTEFDLMDNIQTVWNIAGGNVGKTIVTSPFLARVISSWYNNARRYTETSDKVKLNFTQIDSGWFGTFKIVPHWLFQSDADQARLWFIDESDIKLSPYHSSTGWQTGLIGPNQAGWYRIGFLRGDFTVLFQNPDYRLELYDASITSTDYPAIA